MTAKWRRLSAALLSVCLILVSFVSVIPVEAKTYSVSPNWGTRDEVCYELSDDAIAYYTGSYTYEALSSLSASSLKTTLNKLMGPTSEGGTHSKMTSYDDCRDNSPITDCENGDSSDFKMLYTSYSATYSEYNGGNGWNREHVWPKSLGGFETSSAGSDIHHIRPAEAVVNSFRNNHKYGNVSGGTTKAGNLSGIIGGSYASGYFEPLDNVKGDVARIILYVHVRYYDEFSKTNTITNVFQSIDVLLEWCALDPVDTWEMGRNDVVEDIQGNRNVFIDYPELAWQLFGKTAPANMTTPSSNAANGNTGNGGSTGGDNTGSGDNGGNSGTTTPTEPTITPIATIHKSSAGDYTAEGVVAAKNAKSYLLKDDTGVILVYLNSSPSVNVGDKLRVTGTTSTYGGAIQFGQGSTHTKLGTETVSHPFPVLLSASDCDAYLSGVTLDYVKVIGTLSASGNYYNIAIDGATIIGSVTYPADTSVLTPLLNKEVEVTGYVTGVTGSSAKYLNLMITDIKAYTAPTTPCTHNNITLVGQVKATCTTEGYTGDSYCNDCSIKVSTGNVIPAIGTHTWGNWLVDTTDATKEIRTCSSCSATETRTAGNTDCKHTNTKVVGMSMPNCKNTGYTGDTYCADCDAKLSEGITLSRTNNHIWGAWQVVNATTEARSCTICETKEERVMICQHSKTEIRNTTAATCSTEGYTGDTHCADCGQKMASGTTIPKNADSHTWGEWQTVSATLEKRTCTACKNATEERATTCAHANTEVTNAVAATCTAEGYTGDVCCTACGAKQSEGSIIPKLAHTYEEQVAEEPSAFKEGILQRTCSVCGHKETESISVTIQFEGCKSTVSGSISLIALITLAGAAVLAKKRED